MAKWRAGPERAYVAIPHRDDPRERVTYSYKEGEVFDLPDNMNPSRTWRPMDAAAVAICKRIMEKHMKEEPKAPDDIDDEKAMRKYRRLSGRWVLEQNAQKTWFGPDTYEANQFDDQQNTLHGIAANAGRSVRLSDQKL